MSEIIPNIHVYKRLAGHIQSVFEALDMHRVATKRCIDNLEANRKDMYRVTKRIMQLKDEMQEKNDSMLRIPLNEETTPRDYGIDN